MGNSSFKNRSRTSFYVPLVVVLLSGCFPGTIRYMPELTFKVSDEHGNPISNARVRFTSVQVPFPRVFRKIMLLTNENGLANISELKEWKIIVLLPDQIVDHYWNWCIDVDGYVPQFQNEALGLNNEIIEVILIKTTKKMGCQFIGPLWNYGVVNIAD